MHLNVKEEQCFSIYKNIIESPTKTYNKSLQLPAIIKQQFAKENSIEDNDFQEWLQVDFIVY